MMSVQGEWRALEKDRAVAGTSRCVVKDLQSVAPLSWNLGLSEPGKGELTEPRPSVGYWQCGVLKFRQGSKWSKSHSILSSAERLALKQLELFSCIKDVTLSRGRELERVCSSGSQPFWH